MGGSTTYDTFLENGDTWVDALERMDPTAQYANAGVVGYSSVEHLIQTSFYLPSRAVCAVYYLGWNDMWKSFVPSRDAALADLYDLNGLRPPSFNRPQPLGSPILSLLMHTILRAAQDRSSVDTSRLPLRDGVDQRLVALMRRNVEAIADINRSRGIRSVFIGQVLNQERLRSGDEANAALLLRNRDALSAMRTFNQGLAEAAHDRHATYVDVPPEKFSDADFVEDAGHFNASGSKKFADLAHAAVREGCFGGAEDHPVVPPTR